MVDHKPMETARASELWVDQLLPMEANLLEHGIWVLLVRAQDGLKSTGKIEPRPIMTLLKLKNLNSLANSVKPVSNLEARI
jgi:hypothetical protein